MRKRNPERNRGNDGGGREAEGQQMVHLSKGPGEREAPCPEGGEANGGLADDADGNGEWEQQADDPAGRAKHELRHGQPRRGVRGVERTDGDGALAHLQLHETEEHFQ